MLVAVFLLLVAGPSVARATLMLASFIYVSISIAALGLRRWSVVAVVVIGVMLLIRWLPMVLINAWMFLTNHPLYENSPATIFIVGIYAVIFAVPAFIMVALYIFHWRNLYVLFRSRKASA